MMDIHRRTHLDHRQIPEENTGKPVNSGLSKLLLASAFILLALVASMEIFGDAGGDFVAPDPPQQTDGE